MSRGESEYTKGLSSKIEPQNESDSKFELHFSFVRVPFVNCVNYGTKHLERV